MEKPGTQPRERYPRAAISMLAVALATAGCSHQPAVRVQVVGEGDALASDRRCDASGLGRRPRPTGRTIIREAGATSSGTLVASQHTDGIGLHMTQVREDRQIQLVREGRVASWRECRQVTLVSEHQSFSVRSEYRATAAHDGRIRESVHAPVQRKALRMLSQSAAVSLELCGTQVSVDESFRRAVADSQRRMIHASLALKNGLTMDLQATPADPVDEAWLGLTIESPDHKYGGCQIMILTNGDPLSLPLFRYKADDDQDRYRARVPLHAVLEMAEALRTVGEVCSERFGLLESHQHQLRDFLMKFKEERSFANHGAGPATRPPRGAIGTLSL